MDWSALTAVGVETELAEWSAAPFLPPVYFLKFMGEVMKRSTVIKLNKQIQFPLFCLYRKMFLVHVEDKENRFLGCGAIFLFQTYPHPV